MVLSSVVFFLCFAFLSVQIRQVFGHLPCLILKNSLVASFQVPHVLHRVLEGSAVDGSAAGIAVAEVKTAEVASV